MIFKCRPGAAFHCTLPGHPHDQRLVTFNRRGTFETDDPELIEWVSNLADVECCEKADTEESTGQKKRGRTRKT